ncbi:MAG TPA: hypothetical protein VK957_04305 [Lunatimonas sp.]|nr:hypothetical protein [Lunatimonas sp.]
MLILDIELWWKSERSVDPEERSGSGYGRNMAYSRNIEMIFVDAGY